MHLCFELIASAPVSPRGAVFIHLEFAYLFLQTSGHGTSSTELQLGVRHHTSHRYSDGEKQIARVDMCGHFSRAMDLTVPASFRNYHLGSSYTVAFPKPFDFTFEWLSHRGTIRLVAR